MTGSYKLSIYSSTIQYDIDIKYSVSIIKGCSGRGKTHLLRMLDLLLSKDSDSIFCNVRDKLYMLEKNTDWRTIIPKSNKQIFISDENIDYIFLSDFAEIAQISDNYFIFITRRNLDCFTYSSDAVYMMECSSVDGKYINKTVNL